MQKKQKMRLMITLFALTPLLYGCGKGHVASVVGEANKTKIQRVKNAYLLYQGRMLKAAENKEELVDFIKTNSKIEKNLKLMQIDRNTFEENFVSDRDGAEYFLRYGTFVRDRAPEEPLVFETVGVEGKKQVVWSGGKVEEYEGKEYDKLKSGKFRREKFKGPDLSAESENAPKVTPEAE